jgi:hypothetical protein
LQYPTEFWGGHYYQVFTHNMQYGSAYEWAQQQSFRGVPAHLVTISNWLENGFVNERRNHWDIWLGITDNVRFFQRFTS